MWCGVSDVYAAAGELWGQLRDPVARRALCAEGRCLAVALKELPHFVGHGGWWSPRTLTGWVRWHARRRPKACAVVGGDGTATWVELVERIDDAVVRLAERGIGAGTTVAFSGVRGLAWMVSHLAALDLEACPVLVDVERFAQLERSWVGVRILPPVEPGPRVAARQEWNRPKKTWGSAPAVWFASSGTEGALKLSAASHAKVMLSGFGFGRAVLELSCADVVYCPIPVWHATGFLVGVASSIISGAQLVIPERFSASRFWGDVLDNQVTHIVHVGEMWRYITVPAPRPHRLRAVIGGGLSAGEHRRLREELLIPRVIEFYGSTELPAVMWDLAGVPGTMGHVPLRRLSRWFVARREPETDALLRDSRGLVVPAAAGETGELMLRLPRAAADTLLDLARTPSDSQRSAVKPRAAMPDWPEQRSVDKRSRIVRDVRCRHDRYYRTEDLVRFDRTGMFTFEGRAGDLIRQSGLNVSCQVLERQILRMSAAIITEVLEIAVLEVRESPRGPAGILVAVVAKLGYDRARFIGSLNAIPRAIRPRYLLECDALPQTRTFKIARSTIQDWWLAGRGVVLAELGRDLSP